MNDFIGTLPPVLGNLTSLQILYVVYSLCLCVLKIKISFLVFKFELDF